MISSNLITLDTISDVVDCLSATEQDLQQESTELIDAFCSPKLEFNETLKTYKINPKPTHDLFASAESRSKMFRERLSLIQQRLLFLVPSKLQYSYMELKSTLP